jgi:hypothetical protein
MALMYIRKTLYFGTKLFSILLRLSSVICENGMYRQSQKRRTRASHMCPRVQGKCEAGRTMSVISSLESSFQP